MAKMSIIQKDKTICFCYQEGGCGGVIEEHHCIYGTANRKISDREGLVVYLCIQHHKGTNGVHGKNGHDLDMRLKRIAQEAWELKYKESYPYQNHADEAAREAFIRLFGRNYL